MSDVYGTLPSTPTTGCGVCGVSTSRTAGFSVSVGTRDANVKVPSLTVNPAGNDAAPAQNQAAPANTM